MKLRVLLIGLAACGDNLELAVEEPIAATCNESNLDTTLAELPDVKKVLEVSCGDFVLGEARCFAIDFTQPIQHATPDGPQFTQKLFLTHRGCERPTLVIDSGYAQDYFYDDELSLMFSPNTLAVEHRFQGNSIPALADWDWTALTIANGAADLHAIVGAFRTHYDGRFVSSGASKGGITATYHAYSYPDDLDGTIPYVAPASRGREDPRYQLRMREVLPNPCAQRVRDMQVAALTTRRSFVISKLAGTAGISGFEDLFLEYMITRFDWAFWQYYGQGYCNQVPTAASTDEQFWRFLETFAGFGSPRPAQEPLPEYSNAALSYEWLTEHGFALQINDEVAPLLVEPLALATMEDNFRAQFPDVDLPPYNGSVTLVTREWVHDQAENVLLIYGEYDPWSGGALDQPTRTSSARFFVPGATHGAQIFNLALGDRIAAIEIASRLFGEEPMSFSQKRATATARRLADRMNQRDFAVGWSMLRR